VYLPASSLTKDYSGFDPTPSFQQWLYIILASSLTYNSTYQNMFSCSPVSAAQCPIIHPIVRLPDWLLHLFGRGWLTETLLLLPVQPANSTISRLFPTPQLGRLLDFVARTTSLMLLSVIAGYKQQSASSLNWRSSSTEPSTTLLLNTGVISCATLLICRREVYFDRQLPDFSMSTLHNSSLSVTADSLLLDHGSGAEDVQSAS